MPVDAAPTMWDEYDLHGESLEDVAWAIAAMTEAGRTYWSPQYGYDLTGRVIVAAHVSVETTVTLPRWREQHRADPVERREWDRFVGALRAHQQGHVELVRWHLAQVDERLVGRTPDQAAHVWQRALEALDAASAGYDAGTDHGRATGGVINVTPVT